MNFDTFEPVYEAILDDFGFGRDADERVRDVAADLATPFPLDRLGDWEGETVAVAGAAPCLADEVALARDADVVVAASTAVDVLADRGVAVDCMVTDLDKNPDTAAALTRDMLRAAAQSVANALGADLCQIFRRADNGTFQEAVSHGAAQEEVPAPSVMESLSLGAESLETTLGDWRVMAHTAVYRHAVNGALLLWRGADRVTWTEDERILGSDVANQLGIVLEQIANHERILHLSRTDGLTELLNRRAFLAEIERRFQRLTRDGRSAALLYVDLDNFKLVNDVHGHQRGDEALLTLRDILLKNTRPTDMVARLGGDEFAVWLENADGEVAEKRARHLLQAASPLTAFSGAPDRLLHVSIGAAVVDPARDEDLHSLMGRADQAMYQAKHQGKAAYILSSPEEDGS